MNKNEQAFTSNNAVGLTKREHFAIEIFTAFISSGKSLDYFGSEKQMIERCYWLADNMLKND